MISPRLTTAHSAAYTLKTVIRHINHIKRWTSLALLLLSSSLSLAGQARVAVAANFTAPMQAIAKAFEQSSGHQVQLIFGSSGKLFAQIQNGAPFDILLSADSQKPQALIKAGLAEPDSCFTYAIGTLALWSANPAADAHALLQQQQFNKLAIANPRLAPYGAAAIEVLKKLELYTPTQPKLVMGENISQTYQFVASGNADIGFVALSQLMVDGQAPANVGPNIWIVPAELHSAIEQDAVLLKRGAGNSAAQALLDFLHSEAAHTIIRHFGYGVK